MSVHVPITNNVIYAAATELQKNRVGFRSPQLRDIRAALVAAFAAAEVRMDPPPPINRVTVWLNGPDGPESVVCEIGGPTVKHGAHVDSIQVGHASE